ncbi:TIGR02444 family protein [Microbulbifer guangxiensis]|uniref:TIGR02444 family protein n=1 Tax=Microbulbifer guangxiensis TaxID=2904249 RepID=UPI0021063FCB|nr:TIGR02444 family protein [Microbulbifer guangxiensis]
MTRPEPVSSSLENPLWAFSLDFYGHAEVAPFLLQCQDRYGADVCLLLWASYRELDGRPLSEEGWRVAERGLAPRRHMIGSVRQLRRWVGSMRPHTERLYAWCKRGELRLEQRQLAALWRIEQEHWPGERSPLVLAGQQYGIPQKDQARWAGLISDYRAVTK